MVNNDKQWRRKQYPYDGWCRMKNLRIPILTEEEGDYGIRFFLELYPEGATQFTNRFYKINRIPDQYGGPDLDELKELENDPKNKPCPVCGYNVYVSFGCIAEKAVGSNGSCRVCEALGAA